MAALSACGGSDVVVGGAQVPNPPLGDAASDVTQTTIGPQPVCLVDSDCAALATTPCVQALCEPQSKRCVAVAKPDFAVCDDGELCSAESLCSSGVCKTTKPANCDDANPCTLDVCVTDQGCKHGPKASGACSDDNPCTLGDHCEAGACVAQSNACVCATDQDCKGFATDLCVGALQCSQGVCAVNPATKVDCGDGNPCTTDLCDKASGACSHSAIGDGLPCDDGDVCTFGEACAGLTCKAAGSLVCSASAGSCPTSCDTKLGCTGTGPQNGQPCDDGNTCTQGDSCLSGSCVGKPSCGCLVDSDCTKLAIPACQGVAVCLAGSCATDPNKAMPCAATDTGVCEVDVCSANGCSKAKLVDGAACSDGNACTAGDVCTKDTCTGSQTVNCEDGNPCTLDSCVAAGGCTHAAKIANVTCNDGNPCTSGEACNLGACTGGTSPCDDDDACTLDVCDPAKGKCTHVNAADGQTCDDSDFCTVGGACSGGVCVPTQILDCDDANPCTTDNCVANGCDHVGFAGGATITCNDGNSCTTNDLCDYGKCVGTSGACECEKDGDCTAKEDGNLCNGTLLCLNNVCVVDAATEVTCSVSTNPCVTIGCQPKLGVCTELAVPIDATATACTDGNACTSGDACAAGGSCAPGKLITCNDANVCTNDSCDPKVGCVYLPFDASTSAQCDDGNPCTFGDLCDKGGCSPGKMVCECKTDLDCAPKDDGNPCDGGLVCKQGACVNDGKVVTCPAGASTCVTSACDPKSGQCVSFAAPDGISCGAAGVCTTGGTCKAGSCQGATVAGCDDGNACTKDSCDATGCSHAAMTGTACDDGNPCTSGEVCGSGGTCGGGTGKCTCKVDSECTAFDDGNLCNGVFSCQGGQCQPKVGSVVTCDKSQDGPCQINVCDSKTGGCGLSKQPGGMACSDGDACTLSEACTNGVCSGGSPANCDDGNACTADGCSPIGGCTHVNTTLACDDGNPCTLSDACTGGKCVGSGKCECLTDSDCKNDANLCNGMVKCTGNVCQTDPKTVVSCDPSKSTACALNACEAATGVCSLTPVPDGTQCTDNSVCTGKDQCVAGTCTGTVATCDDGNACTTDTCSAIAGCVNTANTGPCDDGNACSAPDSCLKGGCAPGPNVCGACKIDSDCKDDGDLCNGTVQCVANQCQTKPGSAITCPAGDACTAVACQAASGQCLKTAKSDGQACDDNTACTGNSACFGGQCIGSSPLNCDDNSVCTIDSCDAKSGCTHTAVPGACDDGDLCTIGDACSPSGTCIPGANQCQCLQNGDCAKFEDGNICNGTLVCTANKCVVKTGSVVTCAAGSACSSSLCEPKSGICVATAKPNGTACDDKSLCTNGENCQGGNCSGAPITCSDNNLCTLDNCDAALGCTHPNAPVGTGCDDGNKCTTGDTCSGGKCTSGANTCQCTVTADCAKFEDGDVCNGTLVCTASQCALNPATIVTCADDGKACTDLVCDKGSGQCGSVNLGDGSACGGTELCGGIGSCKAGTCAGSSGCQDDGNPCTTASCDGKGVCTQGNGTGACDDGNVCTVGDTCSAGACKSGANQCQCKVDSDCEALDNGNLCDGVLMCSGSACVPKPNSSVSCPPSVGACASNQCDPKTGKCGIVAQANGTPCDDNDACTSGGQCFGGACLVGQVNCNDSNVCTNDSCSAASGCVHTNVPGGFPPTTCNDNNPCTPIDICQNGKCNGPFNNCFCQNDSQCQDDNNKCNGKNTCQGGTCKLGPGTVIVCDPSKDNACIANTCQSVSGTCLLLPKAPGTACNDGNTCTGGDVCSGGTCIGVPANCDDGIACTLDSCDTKSGCAHVGAAALCNDNNVCTTDSCDLVAGCLTTPALGQKCDDGSACTSGDACGVAGGKPACVGPTAVVCTDTNVCTSEECDTKLGCVFNSLDGQACNDANLCTGPDLCATSACKGATLPCNDNNACTTDTCTATGGCKSVANASGCDDANACTTGDVCIQGQCLGSGKVNCDDANPCTADSCDTAKGCLKAPITGTCDDGNLCTKTDTCSNSKCSGIATNCDDGNTCTNDSCTLATGVCAFAPNTSACNDGNNCTTEACSGGSCKPAPKNCDDGLACTTDSCDTGNGACLHTSPKGFTKNFDDGLLSPIELTNPNPVFNWKLDTFQASSPNTSLYFGLVNPINGQHTYGQPQLPLAITGTATIVNQLIPAGVGSPKWTAMLNFGKAAAETQTCATDRVEFRVNGVSMTQVCSTTSGFIPITVNLAAFAGQTVTLSVVFIANNTQNNGQGAWIDDLAVSWTCP